MKDKPDLKAQEKAEQDKRVQELSNQMKEECIKLRLNEERENKKKKENMAHAIRVGEGHDSSFVLNERGDKERKLDRLIRNVDETLGKETLGFSGDPMASVTVMIKNCRLFGDFLNQWLFKEVAPENAPQTTAWTLRKEALSDWFTSFIKKPEVTLPTLHHLVSFNKGRIEIKPIKPEKAIKFDNPLRQGQIDTCLSNINAGFNELVGLWLKEHDIEEQRDGCTKEGKPLTLEAFNEIKNDPQKGLQKFLETHVRALRFEQDQEPESKPLSP